MFPTHDHRPRRPVAATSACVSRLAALCLAAALSATACGASGSDGTGAADGDDGTGAASTTISPLGELMGWTDDSPEENRRKLLQVEQLVSECMREEGWEYTPVDYAAQEDLSGDPDKEMQATDPVGFGEKHGYGVAHYYDRYEADYLADPGADGPTIAPVDNGATDPNAAYVAALSQSEQDEYNASLYGKQQADGDFSTSAAVVILPEDQGCYGVASAAVYPQNDAATDPDVQARMDDYWAGLEQRPELQAAYEDWAACVAKDGDLVGPTGDPVTAPSDMYTYVDGLKNEALGLEAHPMTEEEMSNGGDYYTASMDESGNGVAWVGEPTPMSDAALAELRATELRLWKLDHTCQEQARLAEIREEAEQRFVDELKAEFPALTGGA